MKKLLSLPPNLVAYFHEIANKSRDEWFCTNDPIGRKLGSGGGTTWLLREAMKADGAEDRDAWIARERRILLHAGGQSRRLPSYAPSGKILTPVPVFRWKRGQKLSQTLLDLQLPLYTEMMEKAPQGLRTMIVSGDVYITASRPLQTIPEADVVCYGLWAEPTLAQNHGVFVMARKHPETLDFMTQKPSLQDQAGLMRDYLTLMDIGIWILSDKAVKLLMDRSMTSDGQVKNYDLYSEFGLALGNHPRIADPELNALKVAILPLPGGTFHHYGTSKEMISSTLAVQNSVTDQRSILLHRVKPHPAMFIQNSWVEEHRTADNQELWIENSWIPKSWKLTRRNIVTGVPKNDWNLTLGAGQCLDVVPMGDAEWVARPYGMDDKFKGALSNDPLYLEQPVGRWIEVHGLKAEDIEGNDDLQSAKLFPVMSDVVKLGMVIRWMLDARTCPEGAAFWREARKVSADEISAYANLRRLVAQRNAFRRLNWSELATNHSRSVFYQLDLDDAAHEFAEAGLAAPAPLDSDEDRMKKIQDAMFRARLTSLLPHNAPNAPVTPTGLPYEEQAFALMREGLTETMLLPQEPRLSVHSDQIVWSRSPVRIDIAGGWSDTPPYSLMNGGNVVNLAIELNGQPPLQVYVKPSQTYDITLRSIDLGAVEKITTWQELEQFNKVGSPFSIPKAALVLAGFDPRFNDQHFTSLTEQLKAFGTGIEMTTLSAIPAGSGLGTSSILASTVLGAVNEFCGLKWDKYDISNRTLVLEQLLTTGGGWQDQYGGVLHGVKLLQTQPGWSQQPIVRWLPDTLWTASEYQHCHLLYYTGITRTAKGILAEIVRGMFLNRGETLATADAIKAQAIEMYETIQLNDFNRLGLELRKNWTLNQRLDAGTNPPQVEAITRQIDDLCLGYKLPGAGGGGYIYMIAKDEEAAVRIRKILTQNPPNDKARFVEMTLSQKGLEISKS